MADEVQVKIVTNGGVTQTKQYKDWEVKCWANTLQSAEEIKADPEKMALVAPLLEVKSKSIKSLDDLRKLAKSKIDREDQYQPDGYSSPDEPEEEDDEEPDEDDLPPDSTKISPI